MLIAAAELHHNPKPFVVPCMAVLGNEDAISPLRMGIMINAELSFRVFFIVIPTKVGIQVIMMSHLWCVLLYYLDSVSGHGMTPRKEIVGNTPPKTPPTVGGA